MPKGLGGLLGSVASEDDSDGDGAEDMAKEGRRAAAKAVMRALREDDVDAFASALDDFIALGPA